MKTSFRNRIARFALIPILLGATAGASMAAPDVVVTQAWARATVAAQSASGVFMQIAVSEDAVLIGATSPIAADVQVHQTSQKDNVVRMEHLKSGLALPANQTTELKPGGSHLMLMQLKQQLNDGELIQLDLKIADKSGAESTVQLNVPVRPITTK